MNGVEVAFYDTWTWLIFISLGLLLVILELLLGVDTGLDLVFLGSAFILGGLITWPVNSWLLTLVVTGVLCIAYVGIGRRYVHRWTAVNKSKTNIDAITGSTGIVMNRISKSADGLVKVGHEDWRARAAEDIEAGTEIVVTGIKGVTLTVERNTGGQQ
jgi:membrane protein implicated in regulation of membrane protease activity